LAAFREADGCVRLAVRAPASVPLSERLADPAAGRTGRRFGACHNEQRFHVQAADDRFATNAISGFVTTGAIATATNHPSGPCRIEAPTDDRIRVKASPPRELRTAPFAR
jgi:hypothetical protein